MSTQGWIGAQAQALIAKSESQDLEVGRAQGKGLRPRPNFWLAVKKPWYESLTNIIIIIITC